MAGIPIEINDGHYHEVLDRAAGRQQQLLPRNDGVGTATSASSLLARHRSCERVTVVNIGNRKAVPMRVLGPRC